MAVMTSSVFWNITSVVFENQPTFRRNIRLYLQVCIQTYASKAFLKLWKRSVIIASVFIYFYTLLRISITETLH
jgi:hypothetical protein